MRAWIKLLTLPTVLLLASCEQDQLVGIPGSGGTGYDQARKGRITVIAPLEAVSRSSLDAAQQRWIITTRSQSLLADAAPVVGETVWLNTADSSNYIAQYGAGPTLIGAVEDIEYSRQTLLIYGVNISWNEKTIWQDGLSAERLQLGEQIAVNGSILRDGVLMARQIRRSAEPQQRVATVKVIYDESSNSLVAGSATFLLQPQTEWLDGLTPDKLQTNGCVRMVLGARGRSSAWPVQQISLWHQVLAGDFLGQDLLVPTKTAGQYELGCQNVYTTDQTIWLGIQANELNQPTLVQVYGTTDSDGNIQALRVQALR
jgi:hypothetical protein